MPQMAASPKKKKKKTTRKKKPELHVPPMHNWRTTDEDELNRRKVRGKEEAFSITNHNPQHPIHSHFRIDSGSGQSYDVEIRDIREKAFACTCADFRTNNLGTCKHVEATLLLLQRRFRSQYKTAQQQGAQRPWVELDRNASTLRLRDKDRKASPGIRKLFNESGQLNTVSPEEALEKVEKSIKLGAKVGISQEIIPWMTSRRQSEERTQLRREYEQKVQSGEWPPQETTVALYPYQREGMLHLAFTERALLADEMGLGKTIQAIAACALLHRLGQARRVLVVTPASLKTEWEEQIQKFTGLPYRIVYGLKEQRLQHYTQATFFTIVNYEQMLRDSLDVNEHMKPDVIVLDEAQRIKNWNTKTARAIKRLKSRYAFVLTGTPIENRIDELYSLMDFLNPDLLGPLFRFNREFYQLDEDGRPDGYKNLDVLHDLVAPYMKRRRKADVETELPERTDHTRFVKLNQKQAVAYEEHNFIAKRLLSAARQRPLRKEEMEILQRKLACMRMVCDTNFILDREDRSCPKLAELENILTDAYENNAKVIIFSEWERMLELVRDLCQRLNFGYAWHTGSVPQKKRRGEINAFKSDPQCRVFLSTDSGSTGLNLQNASIVVNCDLPWNPAKLEQRIARAWRKHQTNAVTVYHLVAKETIEHAMLSKLANKKALADGVLDNLGNLEEIKFTSGSQVFLEKLEQLVTQIPETQKSPNEKEQLPTDRPLAFGQRLKERMDDALIRCEERFPQEGDHTVVLVVAKDAEKYRPLIEDLHEELFTGKNAEFGAPVHLEVIDENTAKALERMESSGLIASTFRSSRPLSGKLATEAPSPPPLTAEEQAAMENAQQQAARRLKMADVLASAELLEEARPPLLEAIHQIARSLAISHRLPEPSDHNEALTPPIATHFGATLPELREFTQNDSASPTEIIERLKPFAK